MRHSGCIEAPICKQSILVSLNQKLDCECGGRSWWCFSKLCTQNKFHLLVTKMRHCSQTVHMFKIQLCSSTRLLVMQLAKHTTWVLLSSLGLALCWQVIGSDISHPLMAPKWDLSRNNSCRSVTLHLLAYMRNEQLTMLTLKLASLAIWVSPSGRWWMSS